MSVGIGVVVFLKGVEKRVLRSFETNEDGIWSDVVVLFCFSSSEWLVVDDFSSVEALGG